MKKTPCPSLELYYEKPLVYEESVSAAKAFLLAYSDNDYPPADLPAAADAVADVPCILCISFTISVVSTALQSALPSADKALTIFPIYFVSFAQQ